MQTVLITGGAGFIGSHVADRLLALGYRVRALDALLPQVHGSRKRPDYLHPEVELHVGEVGDPDAVRGALEGVDAVFHFAARVGVGQSMYRIRDYTEANVNGTATLLEALIERPVERLVVASSMSVYGEGLYRDGDGAVREGHRTPERLAAGEWEAIGPDGEPITPIPTPEEKTPSLASIYALSKYDQERMSLVAGSAYDIPTVALRFFNVYGERQALSNPYTGVLAIFASRLLNGNAPLVFEDGLQRRDFVSVHDVAEACRLALERPEAAGEVFNIGSGEDVNILQIAERVAGALNTPVAPQVTGKFRAGDIRNCFADIGKAQRLLGFEPQVTLEEGMAALADWLAGQDAVDRVEQAANELQVRGLSR